MSRNEIEKKLAALIDEIDFRIDMGFVRTHLLMGKMYVRLMQRIVARIIYHTEAAEAIAKDMEKEQI